MDNIYDSLQKRLDDMSTGFPRTESGVEIEILKRLFSEDDARLFMDMTPMLETPASVADRTNRDAAKTAEHLEDMALRGLLFRHRKKDAVKYASVPYVIGIFEYQLHKLDRDLARMMEDYYFEAFGKTVQGHKNKIMRTIPINADLTGKTPVASYEDAAAIIDSHEVVAIADCVCRQTADILDRGCGKPMETCFLFGSHGRFYVENGMGRYITKEEAKGVLKKNEEAGLVMQPFNSQNAGGMCSCCGCCCGVLRSVKMQAVPAEAVLSNYQAAVDEDLCTSCGDCEDRCPMEAISLESGIAEVDLKKCIGCGVCISICPVEAVTLIRKPEEQIVEPPASNVETIVNLAKERGKL